jgi:hypothetical protein
VTVGGVASHRPIPSVRRQHTGPTPFGDKKRHYGLLANRMREARLTLCRQLLLVANVAAAVPTVAAVSWFSLIWKNRPFELAGKRSDSGDCTSLCFGGYGFLFPVPRD